MKWQLLLMVVLTIVLIFGLCKSLKVDTQPEPEETDYVSAMELLKSLNKNDLSEWDKLQLAIIMVESRGNPDARGSSNDGGLYQMVPIYVEEVNRVCGTNYTHADTFDPVKAVEMFNLMQGYYNPNHDIHTAIYRHNKSAVYKQKVLKALEMVNRYEEARKIIVDYKPAD